MSERFKAWLLHVLRVPQRPQPPAGDAASVLTFRAAPRYYQYRIALWGVRQLTALVGLIGGTLFLRMATSVGGAGFFNVWGVLELSAWLVFVAQIPFSFMLVQLDFEMRWYLLSDRSLRIREGILIVREKTLTYANIQNISIRRNPLQRLFGLATVAVRAAGGGSGSAEHGGSATAHTHEATFEGVDNSDQIREILRQRIRLHRDSGLGDPDDVAEVSGAAPALLAARSVLAEARALRLALTR